MKNWNEKLKINVNILFFLKKYLRGTKWRIGKKN